MPRTVVLEHTLPDGSVHFDWMIETPDRADERRLATWRLPGWRPDFTELAGERIGDHRAVYLHYEGPVSGGRGRVRRVAAGEVVGLELSADAARFEIRWDGRAEPARYTGEGGPGGAWLFRPA